VIHRDVELPLDCGDADPLQWPDANPAVVNDPPPTLHIATSDFLAVLPGRIRNTDHRRKWALPMRDSARL